MEPRTWSLCLVLILPIWLLGIDCLILRLPCQTEALFTIYKRGRFLPNASLQYLPLATYNQCVARCIEHPKCKSFNHRMNSTGCTLNSKYAGMFGTSLVAMANWSYASTDYKATKIGIKCRASCLCPSGVLCRDICDPPFYECVNCDAFHEGLHCDIRKDFDECMYAPCKNNGTCTDLTRGYSCTCLPGYDGKNCEKEANECAGFPCKNDGDCVDLFNGYRCHCAAGFNGTNCETNVNECASGPCQNGGVCNDGINKYSCTCVAGYKGKHCEEDIDECASSPCKNGGTCTNMVNAFQCKCKGDFSGPTCAQD